MPSLRLLLVASCLLAIGCGDAGTGTPGGNTAGSTTGTAGAATTGGSSSTGGTGSQVTLAGSGQAVGDGDQGQPFATNDIVMIMPPAAAGTSAGGSGGTGPAGDGQMMTATLRRGMSGTADFAQTGEDVTVKFNITSGCTDGPHNIVVHDGYACDGPNTEGVPWGERGVGFGPIMCSGGKGTLDYTRSGADKTKNWTVADHVQETDVTAHVILIESGGDPRFGCMNFF